MFQHYPRSPVAMVTNNLKGTFFTFLTVSYFDNFWRFIMIFRNFYRLQTVCMMQFMVKSVVELCWKWYIVGNPYFFHKLVIEYGYWLDLLTIALESSRVFCFPNELRFILLQNIVDIIVFLCFLGTTYTVTKNIGTSNVQILPLFLQILQCNEKLCS